MACDYLFECSEHVIWIGMRAVHGGMVGAEELSVFVGAKYCEHFASDGSAIQRDVIRRRSCRTIASAQQQTDVDSFIVVW